MTDGSDELLLARIASGRAFLEPMIERLSADPSPFVRALAQQLVHCLECPGDRKCEKCPFLGLPQQVD